MVHNITPLLFVLVAFSMLSECCGQEVRTVRSNELVKRDGLQYEVNSKTPFTGKLIHYYPSGEKRSELDFKEGRIGKRTDWYVTGGKRSEKEWTNGKGYCKCIEWYKSGEVQLVEFRKFGKLHGRTTRYWRTGNIFMEGDFDNGKAVKGSWEYWPGKGRLQ